MGVSLPAVGLSRVEIHVGCRTNGLYGSSTALTGRLLIPSRVYGSKNALAGRVGQFLVHELGGIRVAPTVEIAIEPLSGDALELAEEIELGLFTRIAELGVEQTLG